MATIASLPKSPMHSPTSVHTMTVSQENGQQLDENGDPVEDIDERRLNRSAYDYLCRLSEVRTWLQECLNEADDSTLIPPVTELEELLSNGVLLARLANSFAPEVVPLSKIFDADQSRYGTERTLHYRHTDNIMLWRRAMESVRVPEVFIPETVDVYEGRNMKTIYCLYALAVHLYRMRKAPPIRNQAGLAVFSLDEMAVMKEYLKHSKVPAFGDVGGILSDKRHSGDQAALAEALRAIVAAIAAKDAAALLAALRSHDAGILYVEPELAEDYLQNFIIYESNDEMDPLNKSIVQEIVVLTNNGWASRRLDEVLSTSTSSDDGQVDKKALYAVFDALQLEDIREKAFPLYVRMLSDARKRKGGALEHTEIRRIVEEANALVEVKVAAEHGSSLDTYAALNNDALNLAPQEENAKLYHDRLRAAYSHSDPEFFLLREDLARIVVEFSRLSESDRKYFELASAVERSDVEVISKLLKDLLNEDDYDEHYIDFYVVELKNKRDEVKSVEHLVTLIRAVNAESKEELRNANLAIALNKALATGSEEIVKNTVEEAGSHLPAAYKADLVERYTYKLLEEKIAKDKVRKAICPPRGHIGENGHSEAVNGEKSQSEKAENGAANGVKENGRDDSVEDDEDIESATRVNNNHEYFEHSFRLGGYWIETEEKTWRTREQHPIVQGWIGWDDIKILLEEENKAEEQERLSAKLLGEKDVAARKIQENYKRYVLKRDNQELRSADAPSLRLVRKFVTYLQDKDYDLSDELDIEQSKSRVTHLVVSNQRLDRDLTELDEKIGLLIKNRLNLQDVIASKNKISEEAATHFNREGSVRRKDRQHAEALEQFFYHMQVNAEHLANYLEAQNVDELDSLVSKIVSPTFGFVTEHREEFLIVRLLCELVRRDVNEIVKPDEIANARRTCILASVLSNTAFDSLNDRVCDVLEEDLRQFFATEKKEHQTFNLDPVDIYASMYNGGVVNDAQTALEEHNVKEVLEESKSFLAEWSERFAQAITAKHKLPRSVVYVLHYTADALRQRFPLAPLVDLQKATAQLAYEMWLRPSLTNQRHISVTTGKEATADGMHKMIAVTKFMQYAVANRGYGNAKWYLSSLNRQIHLINLQFRSYVQVALSAVSYLADIYDGLSEYTHYDPARRPVLALPGRSAKDVVSTMAAKPDLIAPSSSTSTHTKPFRELLTTVADFASDLEDDRTLALHLHPMPSYASYADEAKAEEERKSQENFLKAKRYIIDLLLSGCVGSSLPELLQRTATPDAESAHARWFNTDGAFESVAAKQVEVQKLLEDLEKHERVSKADNYQSIVTDIANDIRLATARRKERVAQRASLADSEKRLQKQREELKDRLDQYEQYLDTCLANLNRTSRYMSIEPTTEKAGKISKARSTDTTRSSHKSSVEKLFRKGVLVDNRIAGADNAKKASKWQVEFIRSGRKGVFDVKVLDGKETLGEYTIDFQDLLQAQYRDEKEYTVKNSLVFSIDALVAHINRKFYGK